MEEPDECVEPIIDMQTLEASQHSLMEARAAATGARARRHDGRSQRSHRVGKRVGKKKLKEQTPANIKAMMRLIEPALQAKDAEGKKKQKISCLSDWTTFFAAYGLDAESYGGTPPRNEDGRILKVQEEMAMLAGFAGYVGM